MSSIAHMLAHNVEQTSATASTAVSSTEENKITENSPLSISSASDSMLDIKPNNSNPNNTDSDFNGNSNKSSMRIPRDGTMEDGVLKNGNDIRSASGSITASNSNSAQPITPAIRSSMDLSNSDNIAGGVETSDAQVKHQRKRSKVSRACDEVSYSINLKKPKLPPKLIC